MRNAFCLAGFALAALAACNTGGDTAVTDYNRYCAACHGADLSGGMGASLVDNEWKHGDSDEDLARVIREGVPSAGMPGFADALSGERIGALVDLIRARARDGQPQGDDATRTTIEAETFHPGRSTGIEAIASETAPDQKYVGYFDSGNSMCYEDIDLTGVNSIELKYAKNGDPGRFAVLAYNDGDPAPVNLGEKTTAETGGWETFQNLRVGLSEPPDGPHWLCFMGLQGGGILNLDKFTLSAEPGDNDGVSRQFKVADGVLSLRFTSGVLSAGGYHFRLEPVAEAPGILWAMDFLPDGRMIATQRDGTLWLFRDGERQGPVEGTPEVFHRGQGGLLEVRAHPDYADNGWLYLTYADPGEDGETAMTRVVRGQLDGLRWVNEQTIYAAPGRFYTDTDYHFGSRLVFKDGYIYFSIGERGDRESAQALDDPRGKIHRLHHDGRVPDDNPFAGEDQALASIWSYGHRNPQGMAVHPATGAIWAAEHGPRGGDEINRVRGGLNYGWPRVTHGLNYDGTPITDLTEKEGMESPRHHWTPSIAVSGIEIYTGEHFPDWQGHLMAGSLAAQQLRLVRLDGDRVTADDVLLEDLGRIRDISTGLDGYPYLVLNNPGGYIYRMAPAAMAALGEPAWETGGLRTPESVRVHTIDGEMVLLVSEIEGEPDAADGAGGIALLGADGRVIDRDFIRGLNAPKGMAIDGNTLYVSDIDVIVEIDLAAREVIARHPVPEAEFLNDVTIDERGVVYVSDSGTGKVHRLAAGSVETHLENIDGANGLYAAGTDLLIGAGDTLLRARGGDLTEVAGGFEAAIDGVEALAGGGYIVTCRDGLVYHVEAGGAVSKLLDSRFQQVNTADPGYDPETDTLYIPTFFTDSVRAYTL